MNKEIKDKCRYALCERCQNDYTSDFKSLLCTSCKESLEEDWGNYQKFEKKEFDRFELLYDLEFYKDFTCVEDIYEMYGNKGEMIFVDENLNLISDILNEKYDDCGGVYALLLEFMLDNDMITLYECDNWFNDNVVDLNRKYDLLTFAQNDIENMLDENINSRELTDDKKAKEEVYLKYIRHLLELQLFVVKHELENNNK